MTFSQQIKVGLRGYSQAFQFIDKHRLYHLLVLPAILNLVAFVFTGWLAWVFSGQVVEFLVGHLQVSEGWAWLRLVMQVFLAISIRLLVLLLFLKFFRYFVLILYAPILTYISECVQSLVTGAVKPLSWWVFGREVVRAVGVVLVNLVLELGITLLLLLMAMVLPILAPLVSLAIFSVESYFYGFAMMDYRSEFYGVSAAESRRQIWQYKGVALGNGLVFNLTLLVPIWGVLLAPLLAVVAAGLSFNKALTQDDR
jgi:CysZ protein